MAPKQDPKLGSIRTNNTLDEITVVPRNPAEENAFPITKSVKLHPHCVMGRGGVLQDFQRQRRQAIDFILGGRRRVQAARKPCPVSTR